MTVDKEMMKNITVGLIKNSSTFVKELVVNSKDAYHKLMKEHGSDSILAGRDITIELIGEKFVIRDGGVGMTNDDLINFVGRYGGSGSRDNSTCTGKYGMGLYSVFVVSEKLTIITKKYKNDKAYKFEFTYGDEFYEIEEIEKDDFGTTIELEIRKEFLESLTVDKIKELIKQSLLESQQSNLFSIFIKKDEEEKVKIDLTPFPKGNEEEEMIKLYKETFKGGGSLIHSERITFQILQKQGPNKRTREVYLEAWINFPEIYDMRYLGVENKGEQYLFANGMRIEFKDLPEVLKPLNFIVSSYSIETDSTRERLLNDEEDYKKIILALQNEVAKILRKVQQTDKRKKIIGSYNYYVKNAALSCSKENEKKLAAKFLEISAFDTINENKEVIGLQTLEEIAKKMEKEIYYTDVPIKMVKMRKEVINPNFDGFNQIFFCISGMTDEQLMSAFKDVQEKTLKNVSTVTFGDKIVIENETFVNFVKEKAGNLVADVKASKRLDKTPFSVQAPTDSLNKTFKQIMGENAIEDSLFKAMFTKLPSLEYNPDHEEFIRLLNLIEENPLLAENLLKVYIINACSISGIDTVDKVGSYISINNLTRKVLGLEMIEDIFEKTEEKGGKFEFEAPKTEDPEWDENIDKYYEPGNDESVVESDEDIVEDIIEDQKIIEDIGKVKEELTIEKEDL